MTNSPNNGAGADGGSLFSLGFMVFSEPRGFRAAAQLGR